MSEFLVIPRHDHDSLVSNAYQARGYTAEEAAEGAKLAAEAARHGIRTHHALKALHLDHLFAVSRLRAMERQQKTRPVRGLSGDRPSH